VSRSSTSLFGTLVTFVLVVLLGFAMRTCEVDEGAALRTIHSAGFADPKIGGYDAWECGGGEASRSFEATNPRGDRVQGVVCCSFSGCTKACTLRWP